MERNSITSSSAHAQYPTILPPPSYSDISSVSYREVDGVDDDGNIMEEEEQDDDSGGMMRGDDGASRVGGAGGSDSGFQTARLLGSGGASSTVTKSVNGGGYGLDGSYDEGHDRHYAPPSRRHHHTRAERSVRMRERNQKHF
jgi:hypothetical protein